jgi:hypothetical protein
MTGGWRTQGTLEATTTESRAVAGGRILTTVHIFGFDTHAAPYR